MLISDQPVEGIGEDILGSFTKSAAALASELLNRETPLSISVTGGWGSGKSSILNLILFCSEYYLSLGDETIDCVDACESLWKRIHEKDDKKAIEEAKKIIQRLEEGNTRLPIIKFNAWKYHDHPQIALLTIFAEGINTWIEKEIKKSILKGLKGEEAKKERIAKKIFEEIQENINDRNFDLEASIDKVLKESKASITEKVRKKLFDFADILKSKEALMETIHCLGITNEDIIKGFSVGSSILIGSPIPAILPKAIREATKDEDVQLGPKEGDEVKETLETLKNYHKELTKKGVLSIMQIETHAKDLISRVKNVSDDSNFKAILVLDDLDRARENHVFNIFETMKTYLDIEGLAILSAYSPEYVKKSLITSGVEEPEKYLEKLFQIQHPVEGVRIKEDEFFKLIEKITGIRLKLDFKKYQPENDAFYSILIIMNLSEIKLRNIKRILMSARKILNILSPNMKNPIMYQLASIMYSIMESETPDYLKKVKEKAVSLQGVRDRERQIVFLAIKPEEVKEGERELVRQYVRLLEERPISFVFHEPLEAIISEVVRVELRRKKTRRRRPQLMGEGILHSQYIADLLKLTLKEETCLQFKSLIKGNIFADVSMGVFSKYNIKTEDYDLFSFQFVYNEKHLLQTCMERREEAVPHELWSKLTCRPSHVETDWQDITYLEIYESLNDETKKIVKTDIIQNFKNLSLDMQKKIGFCVIDLEELFRAITELYNTTSKPKVKKELAKYMATLANRR